MVRAFERVCVCVRFPNVYHSSITPFSGNHVPPPYLDASPLVGVLPLFPWVPIGTTNSSTPDSVSSYNPEAVLIETTLIALIPPWAFSPFHDHHPVIGTSWSDSCVLLVLVPLDHRAWAALNCSSKNAHPLPEGRGVFSAGPNCSSPVLVPSHRDPAAIPVAWQTNRSRDRV